MKICIIGNLIHKKEILFMGKQLEKNDNIISLPTLDIIENKEKTYLHILNNIKKADLIILIYKDKKEADFIFYFGIVFGLEKKFRITSIESIKNILI